MDWNTLFGQDYFVTLTNEERHYLALDPICDDWDIIQYYSKANITYTRTTVFWEKDVIKKIIYEENRLPVGQTIPTYREITEHDTTLKTENKEKLIPLTSRGKLKPVTASNIMSITPFGCSFHFSMDWRYLKSNAQEDPSVHMAIYNSRNCCSVKIGEAKRVASIRGEKDFHSFMQYYISTCPKDYFDRINHLRSAKHQTIKYNTGDIFRIEIDRFRYCYGLITGKLRDILKWPELPEFHSLRKLMMVPIMVRYYDLITERSDMNAEGLSKYQLSRVAICGDNDIIWGKHTIIGHKKLSEDDIEFNLVCTKVKSLNSHITTHTYDMFVADGLLPGTDQYQLYVEWGTASTFIPYNQLSTQLKEFLAEYRDPHGGVSMGIFPDIDKSHYSSKMNLLNPNNNEMKEELFRCLKLSPDADFDVFAASYGGLTKREILDKLSS